MHHPLTKATIRATLLHSNMFSNHQPRTLSHHSRRLSTTTVTADNPFCGFTPRCLFRATIVLASSVRPRNYPPSKAARANVTKCKFYARYIREELSSKGNLIRGRDKLPDYFPQKRESDLTRRDSWRALLRVCRNRVSGDTRLNAVTLANMTNVIPYIVLSLEILPERKHK